MEVYILDSLLRRQTVVDVYESLIWTERVSAWGDFELTINSTPATRGLFAPNTKLAINESYRVMTVETVEDGVDSDGKATLSVKGRSIEALLDDRVVKRTMAKLVTPASGATSTADWVLNGTPKQVMTWMFDNVARNGQLSANDKVPFLQAGAPPMFPADTIPEVIDPITWNQDPDTLYNALKSVGETYNLGFRLVRNFDASQLYFDVFTGIDRTTGQTAYPPVVFSPNLDNLQNTSELTSIENAKNVAYVFSKQGVEVVYDMDVDATIAGFDRHVLLVKADDLPDTPTADQISAWLVQRGREELAKNRSYSAFDGEISQYSEYKYGTHYGLGDLVELQNIDGVANIMRVTEQIFVSDKEGERSYPTLTIFVFISTGSWLSWASNKTWGDFETDVTSVWSNQP